jgi:hypothetical protein
MPGRDLAGPREKQAPLQLGGVASTKREVNTLVHRLLAEVDETKAPAITATRFSWSEGGLQRWRTFAVQLDGEHRLFVPDFLVVGERCPFRESR